MICSRFARIPNAAFQPFRCPCYRTGVHRRRQPSPGDSMLRRSSTVIMCAVVLRLVWAVSGAAAQSAGSNHSPDNAGPATLHVERSVHGTALVSNADPRATLVLPARFTYVGGQRFLIGTVADAEQHLFVETDNQRQVARLVWVQFEHRLPNDTGS